MSEYHKIQTVFLRDPATKHKTLIEGQFALPEFEYLSRNEWVFTEKVDGTNIRIVWDGQKIRFGGKTDNAQIPAFLLDHLADTFTMERMAPVVKSDNLVLYGEGYGARIQKGGGNYIPAGVSFILFDACGGGMWLERNAVAEIGSALGVPVVPEIGRGTLLDAVEIARTGFDSKLATVVGTKSEGLVMRPSVELSSRNGHRIISKIKAQDFPAKQQQAA